MTEKTDDTTKSSDLTESKKHFQSELEGLESTRDAKVNFDQFCTILKTIDPTMDDKGFVKVFQACEYAKYQTPYSYIENDYQTENLTGEARPSRPSEEKLMDIPRLESFDVSDLLKNKETPQAAIKRYFDDLSTLEIEKPAVDDIAVDDKAVDDKAVNDKAVNAIYAEKTRKKSFRYASWR